MIDASTSAARPVREGLPDAEARVGALVPTKKAGKRIALTSLLTLAAVGAVLKWTPWQQTVIGNGKVGVFSVMSRPQTIDAQIGGRLVSWNVQEGQTVEKGQLLAVVEDTEARYLSTARETRLSEQLAAQRRRREKSLGRLREIEAQIGSLGQSRNAQIPVAGERREQALNRVGIARQTLKIAERRLDGANQVAVAQASERLRQAKIRVTQAADRVVQAEQTVESDRAALDIQRTQRKRIAELFREGLRPGREDELESARLVAAEAKLAQSLKAREIAQKDVENARREVAFVQAQNRAASIEVQQAEAGIASARESLASALRDVTVFGLERERIGFDTQAALSRESANAEQVRESIASIDASIASAELELDNMRRRVAQQKIYAPLSGRVSRIGKTIGPGQTVKKDDELLEIVPVGGESAVELTLNEADASLVRVGRKVRLQFNGFPAVQVSGFPTAAVGTFSGVVTNMDPDGDGKGVRIWVRPDAEAIRAGKENPWPNATILRPGTGTVGWVLLERVPLWYEIWRQFNAFPPEFRDSIEKSPDKSGEKKPFKDGDVKLPKR